MTGFDFIAIGLAMMALFGLGMLIGSMLTAKEYDDKTIDRLTKEIEELKKG